MPLPVRSAEFRFYEELNDHLPLHWWKRSFAVEFEPGATLGEVITALGVPLAEIDLLLVDGESSGFEMPLSDGARVAVYPIFERFDITRVTRLPGRPLCRAFHGLE